VGQLSEDMELAGVVVAEADGMEEEGMVAVSRACFVAMCVYGCELAAWKGTTSHCVRVYVSLYACV